MDVTDKPAEVGIKLNNILTAMILMVMGWVGWNINDMKESLAQIKIDDALMANEIMHLHQETKQLNDALQEHIDECDQRWSIK